MNNDLLSPPIALGFGLENPCGTYPTRISSQLCLSTCTCRFVLSCPNSLRPAFPDRFPCKRHRYAQERSMKSLMYHGRPPDPLTIYALHPYRHHRPLLPRARTCIYIHQAFPTHMGSTSIDIMSCCRHIDITGGQHHENVRIRSQAREHEIEAGRGDGEFSERMGGGWGVGVGHEGMLESLEEVGEALESDFG